MYKNSKVGAEIGKALTKDSQCLGVKDSEV